MAQRKNSGLGKDQRERLLIRKGRQTGGKLIVVDVVLGLISLCLIPKICLLEHDPAPLEDHQSRGSVESNHKDASCYSCQ